MKTLTRVLTIAILLVAAGAELRGQAAYDLYQKALATQKADGKLQAAIDLYERVVKAAGKDRGLAARALVGIAECREQLGQRSAATTYQRIMREFSDQPDSVAVARARLAALDAGRAVSPKVITLKQVWSGPKVDVYGSVSVDGRYLSFVDWASHGNLGLHDLTTGADRLIATGGEAEYSTISRDGKRVAYAWYRPALRRYEIRLASLSGNPNPRTLYDNEEVLEISPYDWSPDGHWVAVALRRTDHTAQLGLVSSHDGSLRVLKSVNWSGATRMFFSPDGRFIAYDLLVGDAADQRDVFVLATDGSREISAVSSPNQDIAMGWSPDGRHLLFASDRTGSMGLWAVPVRDGAPQGQPELLKANIGTFESSMGVTASGALYFGRTGRIRNVEIVPVDWVRDKLLGLPRPIQRFIGSNGSPSWSADGKYVSYVSLDPSGAHKVLVTTAVETGQVVRQVRPKMDFLLAAQISPDGHSFTAQGRDLKGREGIFRVGAESGEVTPLAIAEATPAGDAVSPVAPADDKSLFLTRASRDPQRGGSFAVFEKDLTSGSERLIIQGENLVSGVHLSPDRQWIVAPTLDRATKSAGVLLIPVRGGPPRELLRAGAPAQFRISGWTPEGGSVVVWKSLTGDWKPASTATEVWRVPIDGGEPRRVELDLASLPASSGFHFSPDGRYIAYETTSGSVSEVSVLENFLPVLGKAK